MTYDYDMYDVRPTRWLSSSSSNNVDSITVNIMSHAVFYFQLYSTLHDYACIRQLLEVLMTYIKKCVRLAWKLCNQPKTCHLDNDFTLCKINPKKHTRATMSCQKSNIIQYFLWPALFQSGECVSKAIVVT